MARVIAARRDYQGQVRSVRSACNRISVGSTDEQTCPVARVTRGQTGNHRREAKGSFMNKEHDMQVPY